MSNSITAQMEKILEGYDQQVVDISREAAKEAAEVTARTLARKKYGAEDGADTQEDGLIRFLRTVF